MLMPLPRAKLDKFKKVGGNKKMDTLMLGSSKFIAIGRRIKASRNGKKALDNVSCKGESITMDKQKKFDNNDSKNDKVEENATDNSTSASSTNTNSNSEHDDQTTEKTSDSASSQHTIVHYSSISLDSKDDQVIRQILHGCPCNRACLGFLIEGGTDTPLNYICIKGITPHSPAHNCGRFRVGDQFILMGDSCLIGVTNKEAREIMRQAPASVEVIVQRKGQQECQKNVPKFSKSTSRPTLKRMKQADMELRGTKMTVELRSKPGESFGFTIVGGRADPYLRHIHINQLKPGSAAAENQLDTGDCIISINGHNLTGMSRREASWIIKSAGNHTKLELIRPLLGASSSSPRTAAAPLTKHLVVEDSDIDATMSSEQQHTQETGSKETDTESESPFPPKASPGTLRNTHQQSTVEQGGRKRSKDGKPEYPRDKFSDEERNLVSPLTGQRLSAHQQDERSLTDRREPFSKQESFHCLTKSASVTALSHQSGSGSSLSERDPGSVARSMSYTHADSLKIAQQWAAIQTPHQQGAEIQGEDFKTPKQKRWNSKGNIMALANSSSTLPRKISGSKNGVRVVELKKGTGFLGIQLKGGVEEDLPIIIKAVLKGGIAYKSGNIEAGDEIVEVNGVSFERVTLRQALRFMWRLPAGKVSLIVRSGQELEQDSAARRKLFDGCQYQ